VVDWSFELLGADEQRLFLRLSVFAAGFDIAAAETVAAGDDLPAGRVADLVARLAERSMLTRPGASGVGRYRMLETLRAYAASRLPAEEADRFRRRHAGFMVDLAERAEAGLYGPDEPAWARRVERWLDDLRAAWGWARDAGELDLAARLAAAITRYAYWRLHGDLLAWGTWVAATVPAHPRLAVAHAAAAASAWGDGGLQEARDLARRGVEVGGGPAAPAAAAPLEALGDVAMLTGDLPHRAGRPPRPARPAGGGPGPVPDAIDHWRASRNRTLLVTTLRNLVILLARTGRDEPAAALAASVREVAPSPSYGAEAARIAIALAAVHRRLGDAAHQRAQAAGAARALEEAADDAMRLLTPDPDGASAPGNGQAMAVASSSTSSSGAASRATPSRVLGGLTPAASRRSATTW
jgi:hypothetical protein